MAKSTWSVVVAVAYAVFTFLAPDDWLTDEWRRPMAAVAAIVVLFSCIGWLLAHWSMGRRLRSSRRAAHPMTLLLIGAAGAVIAIAVWLLLPNEQATIAGEIEQVKLSEVTSPQGEKIPLIALVASIRNRDAPTSVEAFHLSLKRPNGSELATEPIAMPAQMTLRNPDGTSEVIYGSDALESKTVAPIPTGAVVRGRLLHFVRGVDKATLEKDFPSLVLVLRFVDGFGKAHEAVLQNLHQGSEVLRFPGLTYESPEKPRELIT